jgi:large subunit ribosomal protein L5
MAEEAKKPTSAPQDAAPKGEGKKGGGEKGGEKGKEKAGAEVRKAPPPRLRLKYEQEVRKQLMERLKLKNVMAVPKLKKICLNCGFGKATAENNPKVMEQCLNDLTAITGQKAVVTVAKKSISNFKLREGMKVGCRVTLRGAQMYEFFDRLVNVAIPRIRDFRGLSPRAFDGRGNYSMGLQEQTVFPEIEADKAEAVHGMDITVCTSARSDTDALELLKALGMPFRER